ncbi:MAG: sigma-E factor negative regulatory protein [Gammaproteobacteria bacterium]|nr:sigma-E factor negative regulatory protein [Gammaproteobacteria bacterium]
MSERMRESLSALLDDEANELELERVLSRIADDDDLRQTWIRYNVARSAVSGHQFTHLELDVSSQVRQALAEQPASVAGGAGESIRQRFLRPVASLAVAASVAATVVIGGQQLAQIGGAGPDGSMQTVAASASPVGMVNSLGATTVQASYGTQAVPVLQPATGTAYRELARQRMHKYMQEHAEHAALNSPQGLIPFARVPQIRE